MVIVAHLVEALPCERQLCGDLSASRFDVRRESADARNILPVIWQSDGRCRAVESEVITIRAVPRIDAVCTGNNAPFTHRSGYRLLRYVGQDGKFSLRQTRHDERLSQMTTERQLDFFIRD